MKTLELSIGEPFSSPAWGSEFVVFSSTTGHPIGETETREYLQKVCAYAKKNEIYLVPERFIMLNKHCMCLVNPQGRIIGAQQALHRSSVHLGLEQGNSIDLVDTEFGSIFLCVDVDIYYPEVVKIATNMGADYIISSQQVPVEEYSNHHVIAGPWNASQSSHVFVVAVSNVYNCVCAPRIIKQYGQGFVVAPTNKIPLVATMKSTVLDQLPPKQRLNPQLYVTHEKELREQ